MNAVLFRLCANESLLYLLSFWTLKIQPHISLCKNSSAENWESFKSSEPDFRSMLKWHSAMAWHWKHSLPSAQVDQGDLEAPDLAKKEIITWTEHLWNTQLEIKRDIVSG